MKALFPLDGSEVSYRALKRGLALLRGTPNLRAVALNVRQPGFEGEEGSGSFERFEKDDSDEVFPSAASSERCLARAREIAKEVGVALETKSVEGTPLDVILEEAKGFDVLVMHALTKSNFKEAIRGSQTEKLARLATASVLLVRD